MPASCVPQGREGPSETTDADARHRPAQARASARRSVLGLAMPPSCLRQGRGRPVKPSARGLHPRHAGFLPAARPERSQRNYRRGREASARSSAAFRRRSVARIARGATPADVLSPLDQARASARRSVARLAPCGHALARAATHSAFFKKRLTFPAGAPSNDCTEQTAGISGGRGRMLWSDWYARPSGATKTPLWT